MTTAENDDVPEQMEHNGPTTKNTYRNATFIADIKPIYTIATANR